ncbi:MAG: diacylglycerol kinase family lipid kinase [Lachnospiraceae bacterium]|nr:diacylglycerol kinase family lipid kinase [Lachnospiraceae bacterium]
MIYLIVNDHAKTGGGSKVEKIKEFLKKQAAQRRLKASEFFTVLPTENAGDATKYVRALCRKNEPADVWVFGGDGTINEAVNGLELPAQITVSVLPGGSGNDYVKGLGLPNDPIACAKELLAATETRGYDVGSVATFENRGTVRFAGSCGIGYDAKVCYEVDNSKLKPILNKLHLGKLAYLLTAFKQVFANPRFRATVIADGMSRSYDDVIFLCFMNSPYEGGGLKMAPDASPCDGKLSVVVAHGIRPLRVLTMLPKLVRGTHVKHRNVECLQCSEIEVITDSRQYLHTDGDVQALTRHVRVQCLEGQMQMPACGKEY